MVLQKATYNFGVSSVVMKIPGSLDYTHLAYMGVTICIYKKLFIDKSASSLRVGPLSPSLCHQVSHSPITR